MSLQTTLARCLGDFAKADRGWLEPMLDAIAAAAPLLTDADCNRFASAVAQRIAPQKPEKARKDTKTGPVDSDAAAPEKPAEQQTKNPFAEAFQNLLRGKK